MSEIHALDACVEHLPPLRGAASQPTVEPARLVPAWACHAEEVQAAQRLRHIVFAGEMGARLRVPHGTAPGLDVDVFDDACEHLLIRAGHDGPVVATCRVLTPVAARRLGSFYMETEFDLTRLRALRAQMMEVGRTCVHPEWRSSHALPLLWSGVTAFMQQNALDTLIGCASVSLRDGGGMAFSLWRQLESRCLASIEHHVRPRLPLPVDDLRVDRNVQPPPLIRAYLRCGAKVLGPPAWDPEFHAGDLPLMVRLEDLPGRFRTRRLGAAPARADSPASR